MKRKLSQPHPLASVDDRDRARFLARLGSRRRDKRACWEFPTDAEYGQFWMKGRAHWAHRVSYVIHVGPLDAGDTVNHDCLNKRCVNPSHLSKMVLADNSAEASRRYWSGRIAEPVDEDDIGDLPI